jgi:hypothetical protein
MFHVLALRVMIVLFFRILLGETLPETGRLCLSVYG